MQLQKTKGDVLFFCSPPDITRDCPGHYTSLGYEKDVVNPSPSYYCKFWYSLSPLCWPPLEKCGYNFLSVEIPKLVIFTSLTRFLHSGIYKFWIRMSFILNIKIQHTNTHIHRHFTTHIWLIVSTMLSSFSFWRLNSVSSTYVHTYRALFRNIFPHHQPINIPTAGAQAFLMDYT
jgi:hypothetical protein